MRVVEAKGYNEPRDALAHDWPVYLHNTFPEVKWLPVPNIKDKVLDYVKYWQLNGFILTGGNNLFENEGRDETELVLLAYAVEHDLPVLGVCRGLQLICHYFNQNIVSCPSQLNHVAKDHPVQLDGPPVDWHEEYLQVNSYHESCISYSKNDNNLYLTPFAWSEDGMVEGVYCKNKKITGVMWHPERNNPGTEFDKKLIRKLFWG